MNEPQGLRERKKARTRRALIGAAVQLFGERGFHDTTVADIAAAAEVTTRTFFLHFPTKEEVLFADSQARIELALRIVAEHAPREPFAEVLAAAMREMVADTGANDLVSGLAGLRAELVLTEPTVLRRMLQVLHDGQTRLAEALSQAYPGELDSIDAAAVVGSLFGAVNAATMASLHRGDSPELVSEAMNRAIAIALPGRGDQG